VTGFDRNTSDGLLLERGFIMYLRTGMAASAFIEIRTEGQSGPAWR